MSFFGSPPIHTRIGSTTDPAAPSPSIPTKAPAYQDELGGEDHPILVWSIGPSTPKDLYNNQDLVGWCYDAMGHWWWVFAPSFFKRQAGVPVVGFGAHVGEPDGKNTFVGQNGYIFVVVTGPPESHTSLLDQVGEAFAQVIIPVAIGILTIVQPEIGIAAALVYSKVALIASGAPLSAVAFSAMNDAVRSQIPSTVGKGLYDEGVDAAGNLPQVKAARDKVNALGSEAVEVLGLKKSFESGLTIGQSRLIQARAIELLRTQLKSDYDRRVMDTAIANNGAITDVALGMFPTQAQGAALLNNAIAQATVEIDPSAKSVVKTVKVPIVPLASSGKSISLSGKSGGGSSSGGSSSGPGIGTFLAVGAAGYGLYKFGPKIMHHFSRPGQPKKR